MAEKRPPNAEIARQLGVNRVTLYDWYSRGCPKGTVEEIAAWRALNIRNDRLEHVKRAELDETLADINDPNKSDMGVPDKAAGHTLARPKRKLTLAERRLQADTQKIRAEVAFKRMRNREKRKELVSLTDVQREAAELAIRIKERLSALPDEFETRFPAETRAANKSDLSEFIRILLHEISGWKIIGQPLDDAIVAAAETLKAGK